jgi:hypothetical protein
MRSLAFIVPVHGRLALAAICLRQLRRTCDALIDEGVNARAIVISDTHTIRYKIKPLELGFATIERDNGFTSRRFNDGIQLACDPRFNPNPVDYVVPCGSDDWVDHRLFLEPLPRPDTIQGFQWMSFVRESGREICATYLDYEGGSGIRIIPRELVEPLGCRPADEDRERGCDTSILRNLREHHGDRLHVKHFEASPYWIVDWKSRGSQLNSYEQVTRLRRSEVKGDPFEELVGFYADEALEEMEQHYFATEVVA